MKSFVFKTGEQAWAGVNKMFINQEPGLFEGEQGASITNSLYTYGLTILIEEASFDPEFDFWKDTGIYTK